MNFTDIVILVYLTIGLCGYIIVVKYGDQQYNLRLISLAERNDFHKAARLLLAVACLVGGGVSYLISTLVETEGLVW